MVWRQQQPPKKKLPTKNTATKTARRSIPALTYKPDVKPDAVDVVGIVPGIIYVDPEPRCCLLAPIRLDRQLRAHIA